MKIEYLNEFLKLLENRKFAGAAEDMFLTQASLSRHIKSLEAEIGAPLLERTAKGFHPSPVGKMLIPYAQRIVNIEGEFMASAKDYLSGQTRTLNIASISAMEEYGINDIIGHFMEENPYVRVNVSQQNYAELLSLVTSGEYQFAFIRETLDEVRESNDHLKRVYITSDEIVAFMHEDSPLANLPVLCFDNLREENIILMPEGTHLYETCRESCLGAGFEPCIIYTGARNSSTFGMVKRGMGIALLPYKSSKPLLPSGVIAKKIRPSITTQVYLTFDLNNLNPIGQEFVKFVDAFLERKRSGIDTL